jgi:hypothetical protein
VRAILAGAEGRGLRYRVVWLTDADLADGSLLNRLTGKRRKTLIPVMESATTMSQKRINSDELAARLHRTGSTVVEHLSKADHRLLEGIIGERVDR